MCTISSRHRVLSLYKKFIKLAKNWEAIESSKTSIEKENFLKEIKETFRQNKSINDDIKINELLLKGEERYYLAETYKIPYGKLSYLPPSSIYYVHRKNKTFSLREHVYNFIRCYYSSSKINDDLLNEIIKILKINNKYIDNIIGHKILLEFPCKKTFERNVLKKIIYKLEKEGFSGSDKMYERLSLVMVDDKDKDTVSYRIYFDDKLNNKIIIQDSSFDKNVLELGAGCGLTGIAAKVFAGVGSLKLTDCNELVIKQLIRNVEINKLDCKEVSVSYLNWKDEIEKGSNYDYIIAADVVYDTSILDSLLKTVSNLLKETSGMFIIASTLRNQDTIREFENQIDKNNLCLMEKRIFDYTKNGLFNANKYISFCLFKTRFFTMVDIPKKRDGLNEVSLKQISEAFEMCDECGKGFEPRQAEVDHLADELKEISGRKSRNKEEFTVGELSELLTEKFVKCDISEATSELKSAFMMFDKDQKGYINFEDLKRVVAELGENINDDELWDMIKEADATKNGHVNENDFMAMMKKTSLY
ncbi:EF-hand domain and Complex 1 LYR protein family and EF-hand domain pair and Nicotinamide N-methyltransferase-like family-containing protein [Strongyloides ratti]|uniref:EF-hand domain and Complex 1 LYR protein family and EF-hand domain pair and Nicotinamide N-methyltransferase-like family-containing protein n=1 Tax=Strongyloides ratti TaxID=34506 RepID=A0A090LKA8_STRRB|nr:EF-hand domain and Complex 1 LYR protein family and EF-hand domain pair and Nicotinamide N-methyltransferase-like family-containing protein [Strongyloides ratti]CEF68588.1 EF-hand domain and Complex 1 LYR protein family and EF-hand domain pair and Nicotinamide N-methyltransferase-like family-containing protein [Strongyloides ratti]